MGYNIDEIIGNTEVTQEFMRAVVELVEEQGNISMQNISPVVKAQRCDQRYGRPCCPDP